MNPKLRDLQIQAFAACKKFEDGQFRTDEVFQRFAELIVGECIGILSRNNPCPPGSTIMYSLIQDEYFDKGWQVAVETKSNQIKKHFGVEE